jgi:hypothetical protein
MTRYPSRRLSNRITRRAAAIVADCHYAARRSVELNMTPPPRHDTTSNRRNSRPSKP